jgi:alpha/beta superfamily hydrolase
MSLVQFDGPAGRLEGLYEESSADPTGSCAVLCHPHPLYGGSMHDAVLDALSDAFRRRQIPALRFNFRGVGGSAGTHDDGEGEMQDVLAAVDWVRQQSARSELILCGYSFGAAMAIKAAAAAACSRLVLVAPPVTLIQGLSQPVQPACVILGSEDQFVDAAAAEDFFGETAGVHVIEGADHFFFGAHGTITQLAGDALDGV